MTTSLLLGVLGSWEHWAWNRPCVPGVSPLIDKAGRAEARTTTTTMKEHRPIHLNL
jgi:hypothetical protein